MISAPRNISPGPKSSRFEVIDSGTARTDLTSRREVKYALTQLDVSKLRRLLECNCRRLVHNEAISTVRSIYFDDPRLSACRANLDGLGIRRKLRLRWYDSMKPSTDFFIEVKWRDNRITGKHRLQCRATTPLSSLSYRSIRGAMEQAVPPHLMKDVIRYCEPIVIVEYKREHFATDDGLRITLDYDLTYYDQTARRSISTAFPRRLEGLAVLEGKTPLGREAELKRWLHPFSPSVGRCSKYVHGCCQLGLIHASEQ